VQKGCNVAWTQDEDSVTVGVQVNDDTKGKEVNFVVHPKRMKLDVQGTTLLEGAFPNPVNPDGSFFTIEEKNGQKMCVLTLEKKEITGTNWLEFFADEAVDTTITDKVSEITLASFPTQSTHCHNKEGAPV
jgi:hypothetical protein